MAHKSSTYANSANAPSNRIPAFTLTNARLTWENPHGDFQVALELTNVFDEYYLLNVFNVVGNGFINAQPARPREWALTVTKEF